MQFTDLKTQYAVLKTAIDARIQRVLAHGQYIMGPEVAEMEAALVAYTGAPHCVAVASGTEALLIALMAIGLKPGDEVITTPFTFAATAEVIVLLGGVPVYADIEPDSCNIDASLIEAKITPRTRAIMPVSLYGQVADMDAIKPIADRAGLPIVEDAAQSILSTWHGQCSGRLGDVGCFSFYPTKNLGGAGDGGFLTTTRDDIAKALRLLRVHGMEPRYYHEVIGINSRLDSIQAAVLRVKLPHLDAWTTARQVNAARYREIFGEYDLADRVAVPGDESRGRHVWDQFVIRVLDDSRDQLRAHLSKRGVGTEIYYPVPLHLQKCFSHLGWAKGDLPETERAAEQTLALPIFPELESAEQRTVVARIAEFYNSAKLSRLQEEAPPAALPPPHFLRRAVGKADDVRC